MALRQLIQAVQAIMIQMVTQTPLEEMVQILGGQACLGPEPIRSYFDFDRIIHAGMSIAAFRHVIGELGRAREGDC